MLDRRRTGDQTKRDQGIRLSKAELYRLKQGFRSIYAVPCLLHLLEDREIWLLDALHKVSTGIVRESQQREIEVLAIHLNRPWKDQSGMRRKQNRRFHSAVHTRLFELLRPQCQEVGILVVEAEEAYTSKKNFALNEDLPKYESKDKRTEAEDVEETTEDSPPAGVSAKPCMQSNGQCGTGSKRHEYQSKGAPASWEKIHADLNRAFNFIRKVFKSFPQHQGLSSKILLFWLSPKAGLAPMKL